MSRGKADEITGLVRIVEMVRDREEAQLAGLMSKVHRIEGERRALKERIRAARIDLGNAQDPAVHASAQRWEVWAMAQLDQLSTEEAKARAAVEDQKLAAAVALKEAWTGAKAEFGWKPSRRKAFQAAGSVDLATCVNVAWTNAGPTGAGAPLSAFRISSSERPPQSGRIIGCTEV